MIYYKKQSIFRTADIFYNHDEKPDKNVDVLSYYFVTERQKKCFGFQKHLTYLFDLSLEEDELFSRISKHTRQAINRAKNKDGIECVTLLESGDYNINIVNDFINFYNNFAELKKIAGVSMKDIEQFVTMKNICIRAAKKDDEILIMHQHQISDGRANGQRSCSLFRNSDDREYINLVSRANRLLEWDTIVSFKQKGLLIYDLGGWYFGQTDKEQLSINEYKKYFGGEKRLEFIYTVPVSFLGYIYVFLRTIKHFIRYSKYVLARANALFFRKKPVNTTDSPAPI